MSFADRIASRVRGDDGFTLIEVMMAMVICLVGISGTLVVFDNSRRLSTVAQKREAAVNQAERELERIISRPYAEVAHPIGQVPAASPSSTHPSFHVVGGTSYRWDQRTTGAAAPSPFATDPLGTTPAAGTAWQSAGGRASGTVFRYVTQAGTNARRVTVAVTVNGPDAPAKYILVASIVTNSGGDPYDADDEEDG
jgi:prepilin-type N-terminal cleavage/methylation domain-containing protein